MDPNEALRLLRRFGDIVAAAVDTQTYCDHPEVFARNASDLADAARDLDNWMSSGGALPKDWEKGR